jgi:hypothetical protein
MADRWMNFLVLAVLLGLVSPLRAQPVPVPANLPHYRLELDLSDPGHVVRFGQTVTWTNTSTQPVTELVFNFYPQYRVPRGTDSLLLAKTLELLRLNPSYGIDREGGHGSIERATLGENGPQLTISYREDNSTAVVIALPQPVVPGQSVSVHLDGVIRLPNKQGRWGYWNGVTYLTNALPVVAYHDDRGWHDMPFVPWHQPFWNEAGVYTAAITLPKEEVLATPAVVENEADLGDGRKQVRTKPFLGRDFAVLSSRHYREHCLAVPMPDGREVLVRCLAFPQHEHYANEILKIVADALPEFSKWFGPFPYDQFTIAESYFGWNGNECAGLIMIDERVFDMPKLARGYVEYLVSHETCHQWWYNQVGTNGYAETVMDEGAATYFTHRLLDRRYGTRSNPFLTWPGGQAWLPNIYRDNYRFASLYGAIRRNEVMPAAAPLPEFGNLAALFSGAYDRGSKSFGMIENRLGEAAFLDFIRCLVQKYSFRVLSLGQFKAELIAYTGPHTAPEWDEFFDRWIHGNGLTDWGIHTVKVGDGRARRFPVPIVRRVRPEGGVPVEVVVHQKRDYNELTTLAFQFADGDGFPVRVPIGPLAGPLHDDAHGADVEPLGNDRYRVTLTLPAEPIQVAIDPDRVLLDADPADNVWRRGPKVRLVPFYSMLYENDLTNEYDRWNINSGPWIYGALYPDPWYTRASLLGFRLGAYRTQTFVGGLYAAFRPEYSDLVVGADAVVDHWPWPRTQVGGHFERRIGGPYGDTGGEDTATRAMVYGRYVFQYGSSMYLPPFSYLDAYLSYQDNFLPIARRTPPGAVRPGEVGLAGLHYRLNLLTPYWDAERGVWLDLVAAGGIADLETDVGTGHFRGELASARKLPDGLGYFSDVKVAGRVLVQGAIPDRGQFYTLGGSTMFRGFDLSERQGSLLWVASGEVRLPLVKDARWNFLDKLIGVRNVAVAGFYDAGNIYVNGQSVGGTAHALGTGLRVDMAVFSFIERATVRFDVAKTINESTPWQFWFGVQHPF